MCIRDRSTTLVLAGKEDGQRESAWWAFPQAPTSPPTEMAMAAQPAEIALKCCHGRIVSAAEQPSALSQPSALGQPHTQQQATADGVPTPAQEGGQEATPAEEEAQPLAMPKKKDVKLKTVGCKGELQFAGLPGQPAPQHLAEARGDDPLHGVPQARLTQ